jgi:hypothetical protein
MAQVVEYLPSKSKALSQTPVLPKRNIISHFWRVDVKDQDAVRVGFQLADVHLPVSLHGLSSVHIWREREGSLGFSPLFMIPFL